MWTCEPVNLRHATNVAAGAAATGTLQVCSDTVHVGIRSPDQRVPVYIVRRPGSNSGEFRVSLPHLGSASALAWHFGSPWLARCETSFRKIHMQPGAFPHTRLFFCVRFPLPALANPDFARQPDSQPSNPWTHHLQIRGTLNASRNYWSLFLFLTEFFSNFSQASGICARCSTSTSRDRSRHSRTQLVHGTLDCSRVRD